jgi:adenylosuccinate lyase
LLSAIALAGAGLERFATEMRNLARTEVGEVREPFGRGQKGSSAMPHKRNPIKSEQVVGLARILRGNALAALEDVALWHERDISHSSVERVILPDSTILLDHLQRRVLALVEGMVVDSDRMRENLELTHGALFSQRVLLALVESGMVRDDAYRVVQRLAQQALDSRVPLRELLAADPTGADLDLDAIFDYAVFVRHADEIIARLDAISAPRVSSPA